MSDAESRPTEPSRHGKQPSAADEPSERGLKEFARLLSGKLGTAIRVRREMLSQILNEMRSGRRS